MKEESTREKGKYIQEKRDIFEPGVNIKRLLYLVFIGSFLLPFVDVRGCSSNTITEYYGYQLLLREDGLIYLIPIGIFITFFVTSFLKLDIKGLFNIFLKSWKAFISASAGFTIWFQHVFMFFFDAVYSRMGEILALAVCGIVSSLNLIVSMKKFIRLKKMSKDDSQGVPENISILNFFLKILGILIVLLPIVHLLLVKVTLENLIWVILVEVFLCAPALLSQLILIEGLRNEQTWTRKWKVINPIILSLIIIFYISLIWEKLF